MLGLVVVITKIIVYLSILAFSTYMFISLAKINRETYFEKVLDSLAMIVFGGGIFGGICYLLILIGIIN